MIVFKCLALLSLLEAVELSALLPEIGSRNNFIGILVWKLALSSSELRELPQNSKDGKISDGRVIGLKNLHMYDAPPFGPPDRLLMMRLLPLRSTVAYV